MLRDSWTEALRHMRALPRNPEMLLFATIQPIMFVVLFVYVFGGAIDVPGYDNYKQYLLPGIFAQTVLFNSSFTAVGIADDLQKGFIDRLRSLPMYPAAVLIGRTISDVLRNVITFVVMFAVALMVGFRVEGTYAEAALATLLLFGFSYAFCWIQAWIGLSVKSVEAANSAGFIWMFPLTFVSSAFVDPESMPGWLQPIAEANPFTIVTDATRAALQRQRSRFGSVGGDRLGGRPHRRLRVLGRRVGSIAPRRADVEIVTPLSVIAGSTRRPDAQAARCSVGGRGVRATRAVRGSAQRRAGEAGRRSQSNAAARVALAGGAGRAGRGLDRAGLG